MRSNYCDSTDLFSWLDECRLAALKNKYIIDVCSIEFSACNTVSHSHCHKYLNLCDHTASSMLFCFFSLSAACSVLQNKPMLLSSPNLSVHNYTQSSQPPSESSSLLSTLLLYPPRHLSSMIAMYVYLESRCRIA